MTDEAIQPLFAHSEPGPLFKVGEASGLLAEVGVPEETLASQIRSFAQRGLVHVRGRKGTGPTAHNLYAMTDLAAAKVLSILTSDLSISDNTVLETASRALYFWTEDDPQPRLRATPILAALTRTLARDDVHWTFQLRIYRSDRTGERKLVARVLEAEDFDLSWKHPGADAQLRTRVLITLRPLLVRIASRALQCNPSRLKPDGSADASQKKSANIRDLRDGADDR